MADGDGVPAGGPSNATTSGDVTQARAGYHAELKEVARGTGLRLGALIVVFLPAWNVFDRVLEPRHADGFLLVRVLAVAPISLLLVALAHPRLGRRHPEHLLFAALSLVLVAVAVMTARADSIEPYLVGYTLPLFGAAFLLPWRWRFTAASVAVAVVAMTAAIASAPVMRTPGELMTVGFYLGTSAALAATCQLYRYNLAWQDFRNRAELHWAHERATALLCEVERLSREDGLTGVANRRSWDERLGEEFERARRNATELAVLVCDVDRFKLVNDRFGHAVGDRVLQRASATLRARVRTGDVVARLGGDELGVLCPATNADEAALLAVDLLRRSEAELAAEGLPPTTLSIGVAALSPFDATAAELLARADQQLYLAKGTRAAVWGDGARLDLVGAKA